jgi:phage terminase large subunit-like protein
MQEFFLWKKSSIMYHMMKTHECPTTQTCKNCKTDKPVSDFYAYKTRKGETAFRKECKACALVRMAKRYAADPERKKASSKRYAQEHKDSANAHKRAWAERNPEKAKAAKRKWQDANRSRIAEAQKRRREAHPERMREIAERSYRARRAKAPEVFVEYDIRRRAQARQATPAWYDAQAVRAMYAEARRLTETTGIPHEVDHIVPLLGKQVCGLHCAANLQVVTQQANRKKSNRFSG